MPIELSQPRFELAAAEASLSLMRRAQTLAELEAAWVAFLNRIERVWYKTQSHMKAHPRFAGWKGKYDILRSSDELLTYLVQARGAEEHTIGEVVGVEFKDSSMGRLGIRGADGSVVPMWTIPEMRAVRWQRSPKHARPDIVGRIRRSERRGPPTPRH